MAQRNYGATVPIMAVTYDHDPRRATEYDDDTRYYDSYQARPLIATGAASHNNNNRPSQDNDGPVFRDVGFAVAFYLHLLVMLYLGLAVAPAGYQSIPKSTFNWTVIQDELRQQTDDEYSISEQDFQELEMVVDEVTAYLKVYPIRIFLYIVLPSLGFAFVASLITTATVIQPCPRTLVYSALLGSFAGTALVLVCAAVPAQSVFLWLVTVALLAAVAYYIRLAWRMVPFAAVNLKVALQAVGRNWGVYLTALAFVLLGCFWNLYWLYVLFGVSAAETPYDTTNNSTCTAVGSIKLTPHDNRRLAHPISDETRGESHADYSDEDDDLCGPNPFVFLALLLSLYWTWTVLLNTIQTTIAGVVATWCFVAEEANQCCSPAVSTSLFRSLTYSFGSICFGSLLQALVSVLRFVVENARNRHDEGGDQDLCGTLCYCIVECLVRCLDEVLDYFNRWAYW